MRAVRIMRAMTHQIGAELIRPSCIAQVTEHARARGETAIGWLSGDGPLHLAPPALERNTYKDGDRIIVVGCPAVYYWMPVSPGCSWPYRSPSAWEFVLMCRALQLAV
jgi:hypothetical protein